MNRLIKGLACCAASTVVLLAVSSSASAATILPDVNLDSLHVTYDGTNLQVVSNPSPSHLTWLDASNNPGAPFDADFSLGWNGTLGGFSLLDVNNGNADLLSGTLTSVSALVAPPFASFVILGNLDGLGSNPFGLGSPLQLKITSTDYSTDPLTGIGSGDAVADIFPVPEPATLTLMGLGSLFVARRRRRA